MKAYIHRRGYIPQGALLAGAFFALLSLFGIVMAPALNQPEAQMLIETTVHNVRVGEPVTVDVIVRSSEPVNVFSGEMRFDPKYFEIIDISYNTSIADLWATVPWYQNGDGTLTFTGGTTRTGGFVGEGALISATFRAKQIGYTALHLAGVRILKHDGLGTDMPITDSIDSLFTIEDALLKKETVTTQNPDPMNILVSEKPPSTDLNGDGKQTIADVSVFMRGMFRDDPRLDFNLDGRVDTNDLRIIMNVQ